MFNETNHYVIIKKTKNSFMVYDSASGVYEMSKEELSKK
jgi:ABC-type bacteriocin/lantibiotic exporter with double-glycine peptidase domain